MIQTLVQTELEYFSLMVPMTKQILNWEDMAALWAMHLMETRGLPVDISV